MKEIRVAYPLVPKPNQDPGQEKPEMLPLHIPNGPQFFNALRKKGVPVRHGAQGMLLNYAPDPEYGGYPSQKAPAEDFTLVITTAREIGLRHTAGMWAVSDAAKTAGLCLCRWHTGPAVSLHLGPVEHDYHEPITFVSRAIPNVGRVMFVFALYRDGSNVLGLGASEGDPFALVNPDRKLAFLKAPAA